jgi:hypothetical protein
MSTNYCFHETPLRERRHIGLSATGEIVAPAAMDDIVTGRSWHSRKLDAPLLSPGTVAGPHGLLRAKVDGVWCVANGPGTWDCIVGEFS